MKFPEDLFPLLDPLEGGEELMNAARARTPGICEVCHIKTARLRTPHTDLPGIKICSQTCLDTVPAEDVQYAPAVEELFGVVADDGNVRSGLNPDSPV